MNITRKLYTKVRDDWKRHHHAYRFQVVGERCSGTNYVDALIDRNLHIAQARPREAYGWKHGFPSAICYPDNLILIVVVREVFGWAESLYRKPWHTTENFRQLSLQNFIRAPFESEIDVPNQFGFLPGQKTKGLKLQHDRDPVTGKIFDNLIALRTAKLNSMLSLQNRTQNVFYATLDEARDDPNELLARISERYGIRRRPFTIPKEHFGWSWPERAALLERNPPKLQDADRAFILSHIDREIERQAGFTYPDISVVQGADTQSSDTPD